MQQTIFLFLFLTMIVICSMLLLEEEGFRKLKFALGMIFCVCPILTFATWFLMDKHGFHWWALYPACFIAYWCDLRLAGILMDIG